MSSHLDWMFILLNQDFLYFEDLEIIKEGDEK